MKVEVEIEDLEMLVFSTAAIKTIEGALQHRLRDPFVKPYLGLTEAHDRLAAAMRNARRGGLHTAINWDEPLTVGELKLLLSLDRGNAVHVSGSQRKNYKEIDSLAAKGCVRIGQDIVGTIWSGETAPDIKPLATYSMAITQRGREKLLESTLATDVPLIATGDVVEGVKSA